MTEGKEMATKRSVLQDWVMEQTLMMQSTLLTAIRGPDGQPKYAPPKMLLRWYRRCVLVSALDGEVLTTPYDSRGGSFTGPSAVNGSQARYTSLGKHMEEHVTEYIRNMDAVPMHFAMHFLHAIEIVGFKHPDTDIRDFWRSVYIRIVEEMNLNPETEEQLNKRLGDDRDAWVAKSDPATRQ